MLLASGQQSYRPSIPYVTSLCCRTLAQTHPSICIWLGGHSGRSSHGCHLLWPHLARTASWLLFWLLLRGEAHVHGCKTSCHQCLFPPPLTHTHTHTHTSAMTTAYFPLSKTMKEVAGCFVILECPWDFVTTLLNVVHWHIYNHWHIDPHIETFYVNIIGSEIRGI